MQFKVPQNVQREDKIIGPLTLKQMIIVAIGGTIAYGIFVSLAKLYLWITWLPPIAIITVITIAFAFIRPLNLSFTKWFLLRVEFSLLPRKRLWIKSSGEVIAPGYAFKAKKEKADQQAKEKEESIDEKQRKMAELDKFLDSQKHKPPSN